MNEIRRAALASELARGGKTTGKTAPLGSGGRFAALHRQLSGQPGKAGLAAAIGKKTPNRMAAMAAKGRRAQ